ncbi:hypothetical protein [Nocardioides sp.]|uniref:hypothetical protein n=1 Tax=Nocardioides sp. TaxID=35761 RepID=UPI002CB98973|nr:hypothetical protein [Nocardioides sp.]HXH80624.1 hypothetical protein [Nocardioides sp.]
MTAQGRCAVDNSAAAAAAYAAASIADAVPCGGDLHHWARLEQEFEGADPVAQWEAIDTIRAICGPCPALQACGAWAAEDKYTGFAAGSWFYSGSRRVRRPSVRPRSAVREPAVTT